MGNLNIVFKFRDELLIQTTTSQSNLITPAGYDTEAQKWIGKIFDFFSPDLPLNTLDLGYGNSFQFAEKDLSDNVREKIVSELKTQIQDFLQLLLRFNVEARYLFELLPTDSFNNFEDSYRSGLNLPTQTSASGLDSDSGRNVPNFYNYFIVRHDKDLISYEDFEGFLGELEQFLPHENDYVWHLLEFAYIKPGVIAASDDDGRDMIWRGSEMNQRYFTDMQISSNETDNYTAKGKGVKISIVEAKTWNLGVTDIKDNPLKPVLVFPARPNLLIYTSDNSIRARHGNGVLGILMAGRTRSPVHCYGLAREATIQLSSCYFPGNEINGVNEEDITVEENAVWAAIRACTRGDILLLEITNTDYSPIHYQPAIYQLLAYANQRQVVVVEPAGNDGKYIDDLTIWGNLKKIVNPLTVDSDIVWDHYDDYNHEFERVYPLLEITNFRNYLLNVPTGAILIGACYRGNGAWIKLFASNYGRNVVIHAQGEKITSPSYRQNYYYPFGHTSGAGAIIAGVVASIQGELRRSGRLATAGNFSDVFQRKSIGRVKHPGVGYVGVIPNYKDSLAELKRLLR